MTTITKERLLTIKQWRETYGPGSNVVLPAEEAEELARIALASLEAEPVSQTYKLNELSGNSPVTPDGWVMVPKRLTAENGAKGVLFGEFSETTFISCPECFGDDDCETCDCSGRIEIKVPVSWTTIKTIWAKGCEHFSIVAPQQDG
ncbi:TPA: molecular chaperone DnaJ [Shigella flexneri]